MIDVEMHYSVFNEVNPERSRRVTGQKERPARALFLLGGDTGDRTQPVGFAVQLRLQPVPPGGCATKLPDSNKE